MKTIKVNTPDGKTLSINAPDDATADQISQAATAAAQHYQSTLPQQQPAPSQQPSMVQNAADASNPQNMLQSAAPSNVLKAAGVAAANAPGMASAVVNSLPGVGNPSAIPAAVANIMQNPQQGQQAVQRVLQTQGGAATAPGDESTLANVGQAAGTGMEMAGPSGLNKGVQPTGPFTAGVNTPGTAVPGTLNAVNNTLGTLKRAAKAGDPAAEAQMLRRMMSTPNGVAKTANNALNELDTDPENLSMTKLLYYRQALGQMQAKGGEAADDYATGLAKVRSIIGKRAPDVANALKRSALQYTAEKGDEFKLPVMPLSINPSFGVARTAYKLLNVPDVANTAGAAVGAASPTIGAISDLVNQGLSRWQKRKGQ